MDKTARGGAGTPSSTDGAAPAGAKASHEARAARALRDNLRRRKQAPAAVPPEAAEPPVGPPAEPPDPTP